MLMTVSSVPPAVIVVVLVADFSAITILVLSVSDDFHGTRINLRIAIVTIQVVGIAQPGPGFSQKRRRSPCTVAISIIVGAPVVVATFVVSGCLLP